MRAKSTNSDRRKLVGCLLACLVFAMMPSAALAQGPVRITLDEAIQLALRHYHNLLAVRTTIQQSQAVEITANVRPNPVLLGTAAYLSPTHLNTDYLNTASEFDLGISYLFERGNKRQRRLQAAKDMTAQTRSLVADNERSLTFSVATQFVTAQLAESTLELAQENLKSFRDTVDVGQERYKAGAISQDDFLKTKLQLLQFETDVQMAQLARVQALSDLRQLLGYESASADYDVAGAFDYQPVNGNAEDMQLKALQNRPDLRAAQQGVAASKSQYELQRPSVNAISPDRSTIPTQPGPAALLCSAISNCRFLTADRARRLRHHPGPGAGEGSQPASDD